jgi:murein DD-endopeptidase MepM/ murein hydrolase activator NlpD
MVTRYGHNQSLAVAVGRTVSRGDTLAFVGSTGRSTGPHVHFEVWHDGKLVNPIAYVRR